MSDGSMFFGPGGGLRFAQNAGRTLVSQGIGAIRYPSPFFDIAHMYLPTSFKSMLRWCRYYFLTNPIINAVIYKMAEYPITDLIFDTGNHPLLKKWKSFFDEVLQFKKFQVEAGLDYGTYGNAFISIFYPFLKHLKCRKCGKMHDVRTTKFVFRSFEYSGECERCNYHGDFEVKDLYIRSVRDIRLIRWNPEFITLEHNDATGETEYYYSIPPMLSNDIRMGKRHIIEKVPQIFIEALKENKALKFNRDNLFHMKRPTIAQKDKGWGLPMALPVMKDTFYLQILRKAQEAIGIEHIVPLRVLFPQSASASSDVYGTVNLVQWRNKIEKEIMRWRLDNNYIPIMPIPVGQETLGGDGRALSLAQEYRVWAEHIVAGLGVPGEFVFGGLCLNIKELALTSQGIVELGKLAPEAESRTRATDFRVATPDGEKTAVFSHNVGLKRAVHIRTQHGYTLSGAGTHPIMVLRTDASLRYTTLENLAIGDQVVRMLGTELWASHPCELPEPPDYRVTSRGPTQRRSDAVYPRVMTRELARVLGYLTSEGAIDSERIRMGNTDLELIEDYQRCFSSVFGVTPMVERIYTLESGKQMYGTCLWSRDVVSFLNSLGFSGGCKGRSIPWCVLQSPREFVSEFMKAYYEGDGSVCLKPDGTGSAVAYTTSPQLAKELQVVLANAGVDSSIYRPTEKSDIHKVVVRSQLVNFREFAGFMSNRKRLALSSIVVAGQTDKAPIPYVKDLIRDLKEKYPQSSWKHIPFELAIEDRPYSVAEASKILDNDDNTSVLDLIADGKLVAAKNGKVWEIEPSSLARYCREVGKAERSGNQWPRFYKKGVTVSALQTADLSLVKQYDPELAVRLERISRGDLRFDEIVDCQETEDLEPMADLSVPGPECYVASGIVCHNSYSGSNVSMRMLENHFIEDRSNHLKMVKNFIMPQVAAFMGWETVDCHFRRFKMADDLQRGVFHLQLNQAGKLSDKAMLEDLDWDSTLEQTRIAEEQKQALENQRSQALAQASIQGEAQLVMAKYQAKAQKAMMAMQPTMDPAMSGLTPMEAGSGMDPTGMMGDMQSQLSAEQQQPGMDITAMADQISAYMDRLPEPDRMQYLTQLQQTNPQLSSIVQQVLQQRSGAHRSSASMPLPEQKPPRRGAESALV